MEAVCRTQAKAAGPVLRDQATSEQGKRLEASPCNLSESGLAPECAVHLGIKRRPHGGRRDQRLVRARAIGGVRSTEPMETCRFARRGRSRSLLSTSLSATHPRCPTLLSANVLESVRGLAA